MRQAAIVVDDFYDDFDAVRARALASEYEDASGGAYPGHNSRASYVTDEATRKLARIAGGPFTYLPKSGSGFFRTTRAGERGTFDVHLDSSDVSCVVFLNTKEQSADRIGTSFFRHLRTGLVTLPDVITTEVTAQYNEILHADSNDRSKWESILDVRMQPNRMVMFPARTFHAPSEGFGTDVASSRLIQMFFLVGKRS